MARSFLDRPAVVIAVSFALAAMTAVAGAAAILTLATPASTSMASEVASDPQPAQVRRFYDAVNVTLATGDGDPIEELLARDFVDWTPLAPGAETRDGLIDRIVEIGEQSPGASIEPIEITASGDQVVAQVQATTGLIARSGLPAPDGMIWGRVDIFRFHNGLITAHWGDSRATSGVATLTSTDIRFDKQTRNKASIDLVTLPPRSFKTVASGDAPYVIYVDSGSVRVRLLESANAGVGTPETVEALAKSPVLDGDSHVLSTGDVVTVPPFQQIELGNDSEGGATVLAVGFTPIAVAGPAMSGPEPETDVVTTVLAGGIGARLPEGKLVLSASIITLGPGATIASHASRGLELMAVLEGDVFTAVSGGSAWIRLAERGMSQEATAAVLGRGDGAYIAAESSVSYSNPGGSPARIIVVTLAPEAPPSLS